MGLPRPFRLHVVSTRRVGTRDDVVAVPATAKLGIKPGCQNCDTIQGLNIEY